MLGTGCQEFDAALEIQPAIYEFAPGPESTLVANFLVSNVGDRTVTINDVDAGCGCVVSSLPVTVLSPGESTTLRLETTRPPIGTRRIPIVVRTDSKTQPECTIELRCAAHNNEPRIVEIAPQRVVLAGQQRQTLLALVTLEPAAGRLIEAVECDLDGTTVRPIEVVDEPTTSSEHVRRTYRFQVIQTPDYPAAASPSTGTLVVRQSQVSHPDGNGDARSRIPIEIHATGPVSVEPPNLFGSLSDGAASCRWRLHIVQDEPMLARITAVSSNVDWLGFRQLPDDAESLSISRRG